MSTEDDSAKIADTAHYTAYVWHVIGFPYARHFKTERGRRLYRSMQVGLEWVTLFDRHMPSMREYLELRHRGFEAALEDYAPDAIVELGAGLSRRGITWAADRKVRYTELDLPVVVREKRRAVARLPSDVRRAIDPHFEVQSCDVFGPNFSDALASYLRHASRPAVVAEGLLGYYTQGQREAVMRTVATTLRETGGGLFVADLRSADGSARAARATKILKTGIRAVTRGRGAREDYASKELIELSFVGAGFERVRFMDAREYAPWLAHLDTPVSVVIAEVCATDDASAR